jgi:hypothetical protein
MNLMNEPQLQSAKSVMREMISMTERMIAEQNHTIKILYPMCNPEDEQSLAAFKIMNSYQDDRRFLKKKLKTLVAIQKQIKSDLVLLHSMKKLKKVTFTAVTQDVSNPA